MIDTLWKSISLGPLNIPLFFIPLLLTWGIYRILIKYFYRDRLERLQKSDSIIFNSLILIFFVWKLSPVVFHFESVVQNPAAVLYLPGGIEGLILGITAAVLYGVIIFRKYKNEKKALAKSVCMNLGIILVLFIILSSGTALISRGINVQPGENGTAEGTSSPDFSLESERGKLYVLSDFKDRTVVLNFWASWCPPCRAELPELKAFYEAADPDSVVFLSINMYLTESDPSGLPAFIKEQELTFPVLYDKNGLTAGNYGVVSIPTTVIISRDGIISTVKTGAVTGAWLNRAVSK